MLTPKEQARAWRSEGRSLNEISRSLQLSKTTVWGWIRAVPLTEEQRAAIKSFGRGRDKALSQKAATEAMSKKFALLKKEAFERGRARVLERETLPELMVAGCMLYWAEGGKTGSFSFSNSDPAMIRLFLRFALEYMDVELSRVKVALNFYDNIHTVLEVEEYWLNLVGAERNCLYKSQVNSRPQKQSGRKVGRLPYGVCCLTVTSKYKKYEMLGMIEAMSERLGA